MGLNNNALSCVEPNFLSERDFPVFCTLCRTASESDNSDESDNSHSADASDDGAHDLNDDEDIFTIMLDSGGTINPGKIIYQKEPVDLPIILVEKCTSQAIEVIHVMNKGQRTTIFDPSATIPMVDLNLYSTVNRGE